MKPLLHFCAGTVRYGFLLGAIESEFSNSEQTL